MSDASPVLVKRQADALERIATALEELVGLAVVAARPRPQWAYPPVWVSPQPVRTEPWTITC